MTMTKKPLSCTHKALLDQVVIDLVVHQWHGIARKDRAISEERITADMEHLHDSQS